MERYTKRKEDKHQKVGKNATDNLYIWITWLLCEKKSISFLWTKANESAWRVIKKIKIDLLTVDESIFHYSEKNKIYRGDWGNFRTGEILLCMSFSSVFPCFFLMSKWVLDFEMGLRLYVIKWGQKWQQSSMFWSTSDLTLLVDTLVLSDNIWSVIALQTWRLATDWYMTSISWIPSHVGISGNKQTNALARPSVMNNCDIIFSGPSTEPWLPAYASQEWQEKWIRSDMGRFTNSILPTV
jgi:hypothetical protein